MPDVDENWEALPLRRAWEFLNSKGFTEQADRIRTSQDRQGGYTSTLKRGKVVTLMRENGLLEEFVNLHWQNGTTAQGRRLIERYARIHERFLNQSPEEEEADEEDLDEGHFALEAHLRDYLATHLHLLESGLSLFPLPDGQSAVEYGVDRSGRRIDILARDGDEIPVVIELKVSRGHERTIGQALYYRGRVKEIFGASRVRIFIVAGQISSELKLAAIDLLDVSLFDYRLSMTVAQV
jgi:hypothetical protein